MKYFLAFLGVVALIVVVFVLVLNGLHGSGSKTPKASQVVLSDYANTSTVVRLTVDGPVTADQNHRAVRVTVGRDQSLVEVIKGYQGSVIAQQSYANNTAAYETFLKSLQTLGFTKGDSTPALADERGYCPTGERFIYEIDSGATSVQRYWSSTCSTGTFKGSGQSVRTLFRSQIPNYNVITAGTQL
jgi:hypothetical protein